MSQLHIHNSISKKKEEFKPLDPSLVGMYVCGPTVYSDVHLGNCRTFTAFDIVYRYLIHLGYKVRYVRNITDAGHLAGDVDVGGEDKMAKTAKALKLEPMEVAQKYAVGFHKVMDILNNLPPSIEPRATGHITEQIKMVQDILDNGYGYEVNGSVYFNTVKFAQENDIYGKLSGKVIDDLMSESRDDLKNQNEKQHPSDFAIWIKAEPTTLQVWDSPWGVGLPGWHLECSAMSTKYLGSKFDIHGGGEDLKFPHHENEIAQNCGACGTIPVQYWMHGNMLLMNGKKMSKSVGNSINPDELFTGNNKIFSKAYSPMVVRFSILQTHYRSTMDLTDEGMLAAEKGYNRLMEGYRSLLGLSYDVKENITDEDKETKDLMQKAFDDMNDDFATPRALASLFGLVNKINSFKEGHIALSSISKDTFEKMKQVMHSFIFDIFGLLDDTQGGDGQGDVAEGLMDFILELRQNARTNKDWGTSDKIRDTLKELNITVKDGKEGSTWKIG